MKPTNNNTQLSSDSIGVLGAMAVSIATKTADMLVPSFNEKAPKNNPVFTGNVQGITASMVTATKADNSSSTVQAEINTLRTRLDEKADSNNPTFTGAVTGITAQSITSNGLPGGGPRNVQLDIDALRNNITDTNNTVATKADTSVVVTALSNTVATRADRSKVIL